MCCFHCQFQSLQCFYIYKFFTKVSVFDLVGVFFVWVCLVFCVVVGWLVWVFGWLVFCVFVLFLQYFLYFGGKRKKKGYLCFKVFPNFFFNILMTSLLLSTLKGSTNVIFVWFWGVTLYMTFTLTPTRVTQSCRERPSWAGAQIPVEAMQTLLHTSTAPCERCSIALLDTDNSCHGSTKDVT